ncbi:MAG: calcium/sodium antiporter [Bacteroidetes bacterium]|nr:calcium/sodium antiporter [Bacteroidota bacterium]
MQIILYILGGSAGLFIGAEGLVRGSSSLALRLGISPLVVGLTVVAFATSGPELFVSVKAAIEGNPGIVVGNVVGSNICNIALILGVAALISPMQIKTQVVRREIPILIIITFIFLLLFVLLDFTISRITGVLFVIGIIAYIIFGYKYALNEKSSLGLSKEFEESIPKTAYKTWQIILLMIFGLGLLVLGSILFVDGAVAIAVKLGVSQAVIGLTIVALGTSLPELTTSIVASFKNENDIAIGNAVGSNVFNILSILGISSIINPISNSGITIIDLSIMMFFTILILPLSKSKFTLRRWEGAVLFGGYIAYIIYLAQTQSVF